MTVGALIQKLEQLDPDLMVIHEVNGEVTRTGDYIQSDDLTLREVQETTYGGYDDPSPGSEFRKGDPIYAALID